MKNIKICNTGRKFFLIGNRTYVEILLNQRVLNIVDIKYFFNNSVNRIREKQIKHSIDKLILVEKIVYCLFNTGHSYMSAKFYYCNIFYVLILWP